MSISFHIFPDQHLVYVRYWGVASVTETSAAFSRYMQHPEFRPGQKQLVDLSRITSMEPQFPELMKLQAKKAEAFMGGQTETMLIYYAPCELTLKMARFAERSWEDVPGVIPIVVQDEAAALSVLGLVEQSFEELFTRAD